jgi:acetyl esterase/lipase
MFVSPCAQPRWLLAATLSVTASLTTTSARADLTQVVHQLPAFTAEDEAIPDCKMKLTVQYDPDHQPEGGFKPLMFVHGGHWVAGEPLDKEQAPKWDAITTQFTRRGYIVYSPEYRLIRADHATPKASQQACGHVTRADQHRDVENAFVSAVWLAALEQEVPIRLRDGVMLSGHSAGAHLVTYAALNMPERVRGWVRGVIALTPPIAFENSWDQVNGYAPSPLEKRTVQVGQYSVTLGAADPDEYQALYRTFDTYLAEGTTTPGAFSALDRDDPFIVDNSFALSYDPDAAAVPPFYFVAGATDDLVYAEGVIGACEGIGPVNNVRRISRGFWFWHQKHFIGACGDGPDRIHVITPADHGLNLNPSFFKDALGWADGLEAPVEALPLAAP